LAIAGEPGGRLSFVQASRRNIGFCAAQNRLISSGTSEYALVLNPDVVLEPDFLAVLVESLEAYPSAGSATGKLWRWNDGGQPEIAAPEAGSGSILDTTGMFLTPNQRHLDRGSEEPDLGQYEVKQYVFGASGAAALYRRAMLEDVKLEGQYFDESFFAYREDADLAWRAQWLGWSCLYVPQARGHHVRRVLPHRRSSIAADINMHSFKNRFLLRIKNMDLATYLRFFLPITARDLLAITYVMLCEPSSLRALPLLYRAFPRAWAQRKEIRRKRRVSPAEIRSWFANHPAAGSLGPQIR
jgi:GT2 family glycosyltransferase